MEVKANLNLTAISVPQLWISMDIYRNFKNRTL